jgi:hypothetical protein
MKLKFSTSRYGKFLENNEQCSNSIMIPFQGKFIRIHFGPDGKIAGADIETCKFVCLFNVQFTNSNKLQHAYLTIKTI